MLPSGQQCLVMLAAQLGKHTTLSDADAALITSLTTRAILAEARQDYRGSDSVWLLAKGSVARFEETLDDGRQVTGLYFSGDLFGLSAIMLPKPTLSYEILERSWLYAMSIADMRRAIHHSPRLMEALWRHTCIEAVRTDKWLLNVGRRDARGRLAHLLRELAYRAMGDMDVIPSSFRLSMSKLQMADATGMTPVYVYRILMSLRSESIFSVSGGLAYLQDWDRLVDIAEFDKSYLCQK